MSMKSVFCIATSREQADRIVDQLKIANFSNNDISVLFPDKGTSRDFAHEKSTKAPEGAAVWRRHGHPRRRSVGLDRRNWRSGHPRGWTLHRRRPDYGRAQWRGHRSRRPRWASRVGLIGLGIPELEAKRYEGKIKEGNILIFPSTPRARRKSNGPRTSSPRLGQHDICTTG